VAQAAKSRGAARRVVAWARRPETRLAIGEQPWCSATCETPQEAVKGADLVVIAAPVDRIVALAREAAPFLKDGALVTDVGSVKGAICRQGPEAVGRKAHFVGSHPMAGSEKTGWENGKADLFEGRTCFVTPTAATPEEAAAKVVRFWRDLGAEVVTVDPDKHDEIVAHISHLPQVVASSLCAFLSTCDHSWRNFAGAGLRDTTRIAASDPKLWRTILEENRDEVLRALRRFEDELHALKAALANRDYVEVAARLERGREYRNRFRPPP